MVDEHDIHLLGLQETKSMKEQIQKKQFLINSTKL